MSNHTPGRVEATYSDLAQVFEFWIGVEPHTNPVPLEQLITWDCGLDEGETQFDVAAANARRLVAAWNACAGIPTAALEAGAVGELVAVCETWGSRSHDTTCTGCGGERKDHMEGCRLLAALEVLAKARKRG